MRDVIEWFWRGRSMRAVVEQRCRPEPSAPQREADESAAARLLWERMVRVGTIPLVIAVLIGMAFAFIARIEQRHDLARGRPWRASSTFLPGCESPAQHCAASPDFFFHTREQVKPWLEIDLGSEVQFTRLRVLNRIDCCSGRATPLVVEISSDRVHWREVARRVEKFVAWKPTFPAVRARWVRLRALRRTYLHLREVRVLP